MPATGIRTSSSLDLDLALEAARTGARCGPGGCRSRGPSKPARSRSRPRRRRRAATAAVVVESRSLPWPPCWRSWPWPPWFWRPLPWPPCCWRSLCPGGRPAGGRSAGGRRPGGRSAGGRPAGGRPAGARRSALAVAALAARRSLAAVGGLAAVGALARLVGGGLAGARRRGGLSLAGLCPRGACPRGAVARDCAPPERVPEGTWRVADRGDEVGLAHARRTGDAELAGERLELGQQHRRQAAGAARRSSWCRSGWSRSPSETFPRRRKSSRALRDEECAAGEPSAPEDRDGLDEGASGASGAAWRGVFRGGEIPCPPNGSPTGGAGPGA